MDNASMARKGTYVFDVKRLLDTEEQPFVINGRMYVCLVDEWNDTIIKEPDGRLLTIEPVWSRDIHGGPMSLELMIVREAVPDDMRGKLPEHKFLRPLVLVGQSSVDEPGKIIPSTIPDKYKKVYEHIFSNDGDLEHSTKTAWDMLADYNNYNERCRILEEESDQGETDTTAGGGPKRKREEESDENEECNNNNKKVNKTD